MVSRWGRASARRGLGTLPPSLLRQVGRRTGRIGASARARLAERRRGVVGSGPSAGLRIDPGGTNAAVAQGTYETPVQDRLASMLSPGDILYDVGANIGFYTVFGARIVGPQGAVYAFEPVPDNAAVLRRNVAANGSPNVRLVTRAVSSSTGSARLLLTPYAGGHFLASTMATVQTVGELHVETVTLDDFVVTPGVRPPDVVKIDVEGAELDVLTGMTRVLEAHAPRLLIEVDAEERDAAEAKVDAIVERLAAAGYGIDRLDDAYPELAWSVVHLAATKAHSAARS